MYKRGKGNKIYRNSGFGSFGCIGWLLFLPFYLIAYVLVGIYKKLFKN